MNAVIYKTLGAVVLAIAIGGASEVRAQLPKATPIVGVKTTFVRFHRPYAGNPNWKSGEKITYVAPGSPAERAELKPGDIIATAGFKVLRKPGVFKQEIRDFTAAKEAQGLSPYLPLNLIDGRTGRSKSVTVRFEGELTFGPSR